MRRIVLAGVLGVATAGVAGANGRPPQTSTINFRQTMENDIVAGTSFGVVISHDNGATWHWMCEKAVGYSGMFDPDYAYSQSGAIFATTFDGLKVNRDGCTFAATPPGNTFVTQDELGPDHAVYYAAGDPADGKFYRSIDDGVTFPQSAAPGMNNDWWDSIMVAPSDATRVYLTGYRFVAMQPKVFLLFKSIDGGAHFTAMSTTGFTTSANSAIDIVGVSHTDPDVIYARVSLENGTDTNGLYRNTAGGVGTWTKILTTTESFVFVARANGNIVASTLTSGSQVSSNQGTSWTPLVNPPHINCLVENTAGEVWACTHNYDTPGMPGIPSDGFGIMKSTDLVNWTGMLRYQDIQGPVTCPVGTTQRDECVEPAGGMPSVWCCAAQQLGITSTQIDCTMPPYKCQIVSNDGAAGDNTVRVKPKPCCGIGEGGEPGALLLALGTGALLIRPRRRRLR
jgi:hypothetical protein